MQAQKKQEGIIIIFNQAQTKVQNMYLTNISPVATINLFKHFDFIADKTNHKVIIVQFSAVA